MLNLTATVGRPATTALLRVALACGLAAALPVTVSAHDPSKPWAVSGKLLGEPDPKHPAEAGRSDKAKDVSGIACATETGFPRICLVADDEAQGAQVAILRDGSLVAGRFIRLIDATQKGEPLELDAEGVAYADGAFYVVGSHGRPRREHGQGAEGDARAEATRHLFRIRLDPKAVDPETGQLRAEPEITGTAALAQIIADIPALAPFHDRALEEGGVTVEGVAVRGGRLHVGLRGPVLADGSAAIVSVPLAGLFDGKPGTGTLATVALGPDSHGQKRGVRDLVAVPDGFLILAGPMLDPEDGAVAAGDYTVFAWDGTGAPRKRRDLAGYPRKEKPEALLPLDENADGQRVLVFFDGPNQGAPRAVVLPR
ncbi:DUF3616 domain-containing protein [Methylobacterium sp. J-001]|uniref:DUF3616 domain-containing protein n=1 Tax=Methylobacterium sp. J-001 TaxID=2836609 RepID=UPI001FBB471E|nr:DUF3616 domain-containing protein [Methylobacterium sp. J-001]MCJ2118849.1 DUF3616 domain-containing protein [Methylobacterium sp. J-001]